MGWGGISQKEQDIRAIDQQWRDLVTKVKGEINAAAPADRKRVRAEGDAKLQAWLNNPKSVNGYNSDNGSDAVFAYDNSRVSGDLETFRSGNLIQEEKEDGLAKQSLLERVAKDTIKARNETYGGIGYGDPTKPRQEQKDVTTGILGFANQQYKDDYGRAEKEDMRIFGGTDASGQARLGLLGEMTRDATFTPEHIKLETGRARADVASAYDKVKLMQARSNSRMGIAPTSGAWSASQNKTNLSQAADEAGAINNTTRSLEREGRDRLQQVRGLGLQLRPSTMSVKDARLGLYLNDPIFSAQDPNVNALQSGINQNMAFYNSSVGQDQFTRGLNFNTQQRQADRDAQEFQPEDLIAPAAGAATTVLTKNLLA